MLDNMPSVNTALLPEEINEFEVDPEGLLSVDEDDYQVNVCPPLIEVSDDHLMQMPSPLQNDENSGANIFKQCEELPNSLLS